MKLVIAVEARDRPGLLRDIASVISNAGANIEYSIAFKENDSAFLLFIAYYEGETELLAEAIEKLEDIESIEIEFLGLPAADIIAKHVEKNPAIAGDIIKLMPPLDFIEVLVRLSEDVRKRVYTLLPITALGNLLAEAPKEIIDEIAATLKPSQLAQALVELEPDDLVDILQGLKSPVRKAVLKYLPREKIDEIRPLLLYPPETAGGLMTTHVPVFTVDIPVSKVIEALTQEPEYEISDTVYVVDKNGKLVGYVDVPTLFKEKPNTPLEKIMRRDIITVDPLTDQEEVARLMIKFNETKLPVVNGDGKFLGVVTIDDVMYVLISEHSEDFLLFGGVMRIERYLTSRVIDLFKKRFIWLLVLYAVQNVTARIVQNYSELISKVAILAAFIPLILDTGGNAGSQSVALVTRALALGELTLHDIFRVIGKELATSLLLASALAPIAFIFAFSITFNMWVSITVAVAVILVVLITSIVGALLPLIATAIGIDPAVISAPLLTTVADIIGLSIYFITASLILGLIGL